MRGCERKRWLHCVFAQITTTFPKDPVFTFSSTLRFPIENRDALGETQVASHTLKHIIKEKLQIVKSFP